MKMTKKVITSKEESKYSQLLDKKTLIEESIYKFQCELEKVNNDLLALRLEPFKVGDIVLAPVSSGRGVKEQKCVIECDNGTCYLRPYKKDGTLSDRHFSCTPIGDKTYADIFKEVK